MLSTKEFLRSLAENEKLTQEERKKLAHAIENIESLERAHDTVLGFIKGVGTNCAKAYRQFAGE